MSATNPILKEILLPWQVRWVNDGSRFKIGLWSRQTGKSFSTAAEAVADCAAQPKNSSDLWVVLSAGERQALEWMEKAKKWAQAFKLAIDGYDEIRGSANALISRAEIRFGNGSRVLAIPANPDTARGYSANLILDEFAIHEKPFDIWAAIHPSITNDRVSWLVVEKGLSGREPAQGAVAPRPPVRIRWLARGASPTGGRRWNADLCRHDFSARSLNVAHALHS